MLATKSKRKTVLIVDDSPPIRFMVRKILENMGVTDVRMAESGLEALKAMSNPLPDLVITDHQMEPMSGIQLVRLLRGKEGEYFKTVPIIMLTGHSESETIEEAVKAGASDFLTKPIAPKMLQERVTRILKMTPSA